MDPKKLLTEYLDKGRTMQLATALNGQPWICTVYFVTDAEMNLYWLSLPARRHSREIAQNNKCAITIPIKFDQPVIGIQAEGEVSEMSDPSIIKPVAEKYVDKYNTGKDFYDNFTAGKNEHHMYRFRPKFYMLFDEMNFKDKGQQLIKI